MHSDAIHNQPNLPGIGIQRLTPSDCTEYVEAGCLKGAKSDQLPFRLDESPPQKRVQFKRNGSDTPPVQLIRLGRRGGK